MSAALYILLPPEQIRVWLAGLGNWAPWAYMAMFAVLPAFFFPVAVLALAGGVAFGLWQGALAGVEGYFKKYGIRTILVCRLLPFVSFDAVSYFAGLTPMGFLAFFVATGIGQTPATIVYSYVGGMLTGGAKMLMIGLLCLFSLAILVSIIRQIYTDRQTKKAHE